MVKRYTVSLSQYGMLDNQHEAQVSPVLPDGDSVVVLASDYDALNRKLTDCMEENRFGTEDVDSLVQMRAQLADARHCLMLMMEKHKHWVWDLEATPGQAAEMERARAYAAD